MRTVRWRQVIGRVLGGVLLFSGLSKCAASQGPIDEVHRLCSALGAVLPILVASSIVRAVIGCEVSLGLYLCIRGSTVASLALFSVLMTLYTGYLISVLMLFGSESRCHCEPALGAGHIPGSFPGLPESCPELGGQETT